MFLPLGFGGRFPRFPWVTMLLCLGVFAVHHHYGHLTPSEGAQIASVGTGHLLGNLAALFFVGSLAESRRSPWVLLGTFLGAAAIGHVLQGTMSGPSQLPLVVGASAGVAAAAGLFTAFFFRFRMKFVVFAVPPFYRTFHLSSLVVLPLTFYATDVLANMSLGPEGQVAHSAHLAAALFGLIVGTACEKLRPIPWPLLYGFEKLELELIVADPTPHQRIHRALDMLKVNPENMLAAEIACKETLKLIQSGFPVTPEFHELLNRHIPALMSVYTRSKQPDKAFGLLPQVPPQVAFAGLLDRSSQFVILSGMGWAQERGDTWTYLRLYETWTRRFANQKRKQTAQDEARDLVASLDDTPENHRLLSLLYHADTESPLAVAYQSGLQRSCDRLSGHALKRREAA
jgi:hypothetical protein